MVAGDVMNTAARIQSAAPVDGILVGGSTHRATERVIVYREHQPVEAKGKVEPVEVWEAVEALGRVTGPGEDDASSPLVGRENERALLLGAFARARVERSPQLVTLVGVFVILKWLPARARPRDVELQAQEFATEHRS